MKTEDPGEAPGKATVIATLILLGIYVVVAFAAQAYDGVGNLVKNQEDVLSSLGTAVFGSPLDKLLIIAVLTSAAASTQTTILPTARTTLSMARAKALPGSLGKIHPRYLTPHYSTLWMGGLSIVWYVGLTIVSEDILFDSLAALGLMIAFYIGITGFACTIYYRRELTRSVKKPNSLSQFVVVNANTGAPVVSVDHVPVTKRASFTGQYYRSQAFVPIEPFRGRHQCLEHLGV